MGQPAFSQTALLAGPKAVSAVIGSVGTPTMVRSAPIIVETGTLYFGAFTGATAMLRDTKAGPCAKYIFNVRASYAQEARATLEFFFAQKVPDDKHVISFDQNDTFGDAGYNGLVAAYQALRDAPPVFQRFRYSRDDATSVPAQSTAAIAYLKGLLAADTLPHTVGVMMTDTYGPATQFIKALKEWQYAADAEQTQLNKASRLTLLFSNVSFVGPNSLAQRLHDLGNVTTPSGAKPYTENVFVSQVVPNYDSDNSDAVLEYKRLVQPSGAAPTFTALEGYLAGRVFVEGLKANNGKHHCRQPGHRPREPPDAGPRLRRRCRLLEGQPSVLEVGLRHRDHSRRQVPEPLLLERRQQDPALRVSALQRLSDRVCAPSRSPDRARRASRTRGRTASRPRSPRGCACS